MRAVIAATLLVCLAAEDARAGDAGLLTTSALPHLSEPVQSIVFRYEMDSLAAILELDLGRARITFDVANALELPEHEAPGAISLDDGSLPADVLHGFEVDAGIERMFSLTFSFDW